MEAWDNFLDQVNSLLGQSGQGNGLWRLVASLAILVAGLIVLEVIFRFAHRRFQAAMEKKGHRPDDWNLENCSLSAALEAGSDGIAVANN